jgi:hypothetical protein
MGWIAFAYIIVPAVLHTGSILILNRFDLNPEDMAAEQA